MLSDSFILLFFHQNAGFVLGSPSNYQFFPVKLRAIFSPKLLSDTNLRPLEEFSNRTLYPF